MKRGPTREEKIIEDLEDLLALEAARWVGGAWSGCGSRSVSWPSRRWPSCSRSLVSVPGAVAGDDRHRLCDRGPRGHDSQVALGSSRNDVISKIDGTAPGQITWNSTLFSSMAAYVVPLLGLLTAISFDMLDLFRSVLGPILRIFP